MTGFLTIYTGALVFVLGTVFGSFLTCLAQRLPRGESVLRGRSHCDSCGHVLGAGDLVPVLSWVFLRGKCRYCGAKIGPTDLVSELFLGACFLASFLRFGVSFSALSGMVLSAILLCLSLVDMATYTIPDGCILAGVICWVLFCPMQVFSGEIGWISLISGRRGVGDVSSRMGLLFRLYGAGLIGGFTIAAFLLFMSLLMDHILKKESLGGGDIKLIFLSGLYLGLLGNLFNLILSCIVGLIFAAGKKAERIPFGPAISLSTFLCFLFGQSFVDWYLSLTGIL